VVDEVGYIRFEPEAANLFLQLVSSRYEVVALKGDSYWLKDRDLGRVPTAATDEHEPEDVNLDCRLPLPE
jgi:hypothetical protein